MKHDSNLFSSFRCAFAGIWEALRTQRNLRIHSAIGLAVVVASLVLRLTPVEWAIIALTIGSMFAAELFNTVVEANVDLFTDRYHPLARQAKDIAAGAVLTTAITSVVVGLLILGPHLLDRIAR